MSYETLIVETPSAGVTLVRLNRPEALNALNSQLLRELGEALTEADHNDKVRCIVLTGSEKANQIGNETVKEVKEAMHIYIGD